MSSEGARQGDGRDEGNPELLAAGDDAPGAFEPAILRDGASNGTEDDVTLAAIEDAEASLGRIDPSSHPAIAKPIAITAMTFTAGW